MKRITALLLMLACFTACLCGCSVVCPAGSASTIGTTLGTDSVPTVTEPKPMPQHQPPKWENVYSAANYDNWNDKGKIPAGTVYISQYLSLIFSVATDADQVYPIGIEETTGASTDEVYETFIKSLGVEEDYKKNKTIWVTQAQLAAITWPEEFGFYLYKAYGPEYDAKIDEAYLRSCGQNTVPVMIKLNSAVELPQADVEAEIVRIWNEYGVLLRYGTLVKAGIGTSQFVYANAPADKLLSLLSDALMGEMTHQDSLADIPYSDY